MEEEFHPCDDCVNPDACRSNDECVVQKIITEKVPEADDELR